MNRFWAQVVQQWYTKIGTFIPYRLGHIENIFWTLVNGLFIFWTRSAFTMLPTTRFVLSSTCLALGRAPALQLRPTVLSQALAAITSRPGFDPYPLSLYPEYSQMSHCSWTMLGYAGPSKQLSHTHSLRFCGVPTLNKPESAALIQITLGGKRQNG